MALTWGPSKTWMSFTETTFAIRITRVPISMLIKITKVIMDMRGSHSHQRHKDHRNHQIIKGHGGSTWALLTDLCFELVEMCRDNRANKVNFHLVWQFSDRIRPVLMVCLVCFKRTQVVGKGGILIFAKFNEKQTPRSHRELWRHDYISPTPLPSHKRTCPYLNINCFECSKFTLRFFEDSTWKQLCDHCV